MVWLLVVTVGLIACMLAVVLSYGDRSLLADKPLVYPYEDGLVTPGVDLEKALGLSDVGGRLKGAIVVVVRRNCVGSWRLFRDVGDMVLGQAWWVTCDRDDLTFPVGGMGKVLRTTRASIQRLRTPQAIFVGDDGQVWGRGIVNTAGKWRRFLEEWGPKAQAQAPSVSGGGGTHSVMPSAR